MDKVGSKLKKTREALGLSQGDVARISGVTQSTISGIESGGIDLKLSTLQKLASSLNITPASLIGDTDPNEIETVVKSLFDYLNTLLKQETSENFINHSNVLRYSFKDPSSPHMKKLIANIVLLQSSVLDKLGSYEVNKFLLKEQLDIIGRDDPYLNSKIKVALGVQHSRDDNYLQALQSYEEALLGFKEKSTEWVITNNHICCALGFQGKYQEAIERLDNLRRIDGLAVSLNINILGNLGCMFGCLWRDNNDPANFDRSLKYLETAINEANASSFTLLKSRYASIKGALYAGNGDIDKAEKLMIESERFLKEEHKLFSAKNLSNLGCLYLNQGDMGKAVNYINESLNKFSELKDRLFIGICNCQLGLAFQITGEFDAAQDKFSNAQRISEVIMSDFLSKYVSYCKNADHKKLEQLKYLYVYLGSSVSDAFPLH